MGKLNNTKCTMTKYTVFINFKFVFLKKFFNVWWLGWLRNWYSISSNMNISFCKWSILRTVFFSTLIKKNLKTFWGTYKAYSCLFCWIAFATFAEIRNWEMCGFLGLVAVRLLDWIPAISFLSNNCTNPVQTILCFRTFSAGRLLFLEILQIFSLLCLF